jgi:hypothetical protein
MRPISVKGVVVGALVDIVGSNVGALPIAIVAVTRVDLTGLPRAEQGPAITAALHSDPVLYSAGLLVGGLFSVLGGYVAAHVAKRGEVVNGALSSVACVLIGVWAFAYGSGSQPLWQHLVYVALSPALGALGGYLQLRRSNLSPAMQPGT